MMIAWQIFCWLVAFGASVLASPVEVLSAEALGSSIISDLKSIWRSTQRSGGCYARYQAVTEMGTFRAVGKRG